MINIAKYEEILDNGLSLDHYFVLLHLYNNQIYSDHRKVKGFKSLLELRGYIKDGVLTEKGIDLVQEEILEVPALESITTTTTTTVQDIKEQPFNEWVVGLHLRLQARLKTLTGKVQVRDRVKGKAHSFLCNPLDLATNLKKIKDKYKITDREKIEAILMKHVDECHKANHWFPIIYYYIFRENQSRLVTDLETYVEPEADKTEQDNNNKIDYATEG